MEQEKKVEVVLAPTTPVVKVEDPVVRAVLNGREVIPQPFFWFRHRELLK
jgi:hypothetical protein